MRPRNEYTVDGSGRNFSYDGLEEYRLDLVEQLIEDGKLLRAERYLEMSLEEFAHQGGYVIVED